MQKFLGCLLILVIKSTQDWAARIRECNSVNLKPGQSIEPLLKTVNVLCMRPRLGIAHSNQPAQHGYSGVRSVGAFLSHLEKSTSWLNLIRKLFPVFQKVGRLVTEEE